MIMDEILTENEIKELQKKNRIRESKGDIVYYVVVGIILALLVIQQIEKSWFIILIDQSRLKNFHKIF